MKIKSFNKTDYISSRKSILKLLVQTAHEAGSNSAHIGGALSSVDILTVLFKYFLGLNKINIKKFDRNYFILSKGHACLVYYSVLAHYGFIDFEELKTFEKDGSKLLGHPVLNTDLGIDFSTGSLGNGVGIGVGLAIGLKKMKSESNVYIIVGDGECNEGSVWEAFMSAAHYKLDNLTVIVDKNNFQQTGTSSEILDLISISKKIETFGFNVFDIDGHDPLVLYDNFKKKINNQPKAIVANTTKGKYLSFAENNNQFHHTIMTKSLYEQAIKEIENV